MGFLGRGRSSRVVEAMLLDLLARAGSPGCQAPGDSWSRSRLRLEHVRVHRPRRILAAIGLVAARIRRAGSGTARGDSGFR